MIEILARDRIDPHEKTATNHMVRHKHSCDLIRCKNFHPSHARHDSTPNPRRSKIDSLGIRTISSHEINYPRCPFRSPACSCFPPRASNHPPLLIIRDSVDQVRTEALFLDTCILEILLWHAGVPKTDDPDTASTTRHGIRRYQTEEGQAEPPPWISFRSQDRTKTQVRSAFRTGISMISATCETVSPAKYFNSTSWPCCEFR